MNIKYMSEFNHTTRKIRSVVLVIFSLLIISCSENNSYFSPKGIVDKTEEYAVLNNWKELSNFEKVDGYTRIGDSIFGGDIDCNIEPLSGIDVLSFKVLSGTEYAKDKNNVYYPKGITCIDYFDCGVCYYDSFIIEEANPKTFSYLGNDYGVDGVNVYFRGELMPGVHSATFEIINGPEYFYFAKDKNNVYNKNVLLKCFDSKTFKYNPTDSLNSIQENRCVVRDKNNKWLYMPPNSFEKIDSIY